MKWKTIPQNNGKNVLETGIPDIQREVQKFRDQSRAAAQAAANLRKSRAAGQAAAASGIQVVSTTTDANTEKHLRRKESWDDIGQTRCSWERRC